MHTRGPAAGKADVVIIELTIPGAPRTKKNHGRVVMRGGRKLHLPSEAYSDYRARVLPLLKQWQTACLKRPLAIALNCAATFYRDADRGDAVGYYQGLADLLQEAGIVQDDKFIVSWDGSRLARDASRPRVELALTTKD